MIVAGLLVLATADAAGRAAAPDFVELPTDGAATNHGAALAVLARDALLACWYAGSSEANADSRILCSRSGDGGDRWGAAFRVVGPAEQALGAARSAKAVGNVTLAHDGLGRLWMIYGVIQRWDWPVVGNLCRNWLCGRVDARVSADDGRSWSPAFRLDDRVGALPRGRPLALGGERDLIPLYREGARRAHLLDLDLSHLDAVTVSGATVRDLPGSDIIQPSLVAAPDGRVRIFFRDTTAQWVRTALFDPGSGIASPAQSTDLANPGSAVEAFADDAGRFVLIHNRGTDDRHVLSLAVSVDGLHFREGCALADGQGEVAYPAMARTADGVWHVLYSAAGKSVIRHVRFDAAWLAACLGD